MSTRRIVILAAVLTVVGALALAAAGRGGELDGPDGTLAFQRLVASFGGDVRPSDRPVDGATFLLLADLRSIPEAQALLTWVESGGRLVVADPTSAVASSLGVAPGAFVSGSLFGVATLEPRCAVPEVVGVTRVHVRAVDASLAPTDPGLIGCFGTDADAPFLVAAPHGAGRVVVLGGPSLFWNEFLDTEDNAVLALGVVGGPGADVVMGAPVAASRGPEGPWEALPSPARTVVTGLVLAVFVFLLARWRRLGSPREEHLPSPIPASALVEATGALLRSSADRAFVAGILREHHAARMRRRLGLPADLTPAEVGRAVDERSNDRLGAETLLARRDPEDDEELLRLARDLRRLSQQIEERS